MRSAWEALPRRLATDGHITLNVFFSEPFHDTTCAETEGQGEREREGHMCVCVCVQVWESAPPAVSAVPPGAVPPLQQAGQRQSEATHTTTLFDCVVPSSVRVCVCVCVCRTGRQPPSSSTPTSIGTSTSGSRHSMPSSTATVVQSPDTHTQRGREGGRAGERETEICVYVCVCVCSSDRRHDLQQAQRVHTRLPACRKGHRVPRRPCDHLHLTIALPNSRCPSRIRSACPLTHTERERGRETCLCVSLCLCGKV